jgi:serine phosphatase RsbU (regulator of sigma subunit)
MLLRRDGVIRHLDATGGPLGLLPGLDYASGSISLTAGDTFLMCTDGVLEAGVECDLEDFGVARTEACFAGATTAAELADAVAGALERYLAGAHPHDDVTMLCARCL